MTLASLQRQQGAANKLLITLLLVIVLLLVAVIGVGGWMLASGKTDLKALFEAPEPPPVEMSEEPIFKELDKFVVSLADTRTQRYMMLELSLVSHHPDMPERATELSSVIRNALLKYFSRLTRDNVQEQLADIETLQDMIQGVLTQAADQYGAELPVEQVLITNVVIQ